MTTYAFGLHTLRLGTATRSLKHPVTGEVIEVPQDEGLTDDEQRTLKNMIETAGGVGPDDFGFYLICWPKDEHIRIGAGELHSGTGKCKTLTIESEQPFATKAIEFVFSIGCRCNMAFRSSVNPELVAMPPGPLGESGSPRWPSAVTLTNATDLSEWLHNTLRLPIAPDSER